MICLDALVSIQETIKLFRAPTLLHYLRLRPMSHLWDPSKCDGNRSFSIFIPILGRMFSRCNKALQDLGEEPIDWTIQ